MIQGCILWVLTSAGISCYLQIVARSIIKSPAIVIADFLHSSVITYNTRILPVQWVTVAQSPANLSALCQRGLVTKTIHIIHPDNATSYNKNKILLASSTPTRYIKGFFAYVLSWQVKIWSKTVSVHICWGWCGGRDGQRNFMFTSLAHDYRKDRR